jgi:antitoxin CcdA
MNTNRTPAMHATDDSQAPKKATNPRANADLLHKAREMDINTDRTRSPQAAAARAMAGAEKKRTAIATYNDHVEQHGVFSDGLRTF